jgi:hypothetical protein
MCSRNQIFVPGPGVVFRGLVSCTCGMPLCQKAIWPILGGPTFWRAFPDPRGRTDFKNAPPKISGPGRSAVPPTPFRPGGVGGIVGARILGPDCVLPHLGPGVFPVSCDTRLRGHRRCHVGCAATAAATRCSLAASGAERDGWSRDE